VNSSTLSDSTTCPTIASSVFVIRMTSLDPDPSASKIPARKPFRHEIDGDVGHRINSRIRWTSSRRPVAIADSAFRVVVAAWKRERLVAMPNKDRYVAVRSKPSSSTRARRKRWTCHRSLEGSPYPYDPTWPSPRIIPVAYPSR
jgi:hypothetical protein